MKHRGRHRRRRRGRGAARHSGRNRPRAHRGRHADQHLPGHGQQQSGALTPLTSAAETGRLQLHENLVAGNTLSTLSRNMGGNVGVSGVLASADHTMRDEADCSGTERAALPLEPVATRAYCWASDDAAEPEWAPASVTTSGAR